MFNLKSLKFSVLKSFNLCKKERDARYAVIVLGLSSFLKKHHVEKLKRHDLLKGQLKVTGDDLSKSRKALRAELCFFHEEFAWHADKREILSFSKFSGRNFLISGGTTVEYFFSKDSKTW